ncbi:MATE efflux family protein [Artemisia annua]|uniref:MATE efflux family protein n=1 Tax=Artemisia annua TaxID=35608 RepID=A0A2U1LSM9_ARTAN|nr:MATE efflux family protein [Artemisia annua]
MSTTTCLLSNHQFLHPSKKFQHNRYLKNSFIRFRTPRNIIVSSSSKQNSSSPSPVEKPQTSNPFILLVHAFRDKVKLDDLGIEIVSIALPAALALAADPITSLVDTAFVGHLVSLASVPSQCCAYCCFLFIWSHIALLSTRSFTLTTSFVAEEQAVLVKDGDDSTCVDQDDNTGHQKTFLPSVSTSLALATAFGIAQTIALYFGSGFLLNTMGIPVNSPMRVPAEEFTSVRAFGAPAVVLALAAQGTFRGFKDTKTPLYGIAAGNLLNAILNPILIFFCGFGVGGAATATIPDCLHSTMEVE